MSVALCEGKHNVISVIIIHELNIVKRNGVNAKIPKRARLFLIWQQLDIHFPLDQGNAFLKSLSLYGSGLEFSNTNYSSEMWKRGIK